MCHDMKRFEKMAEDKRLREKESETEFIVKEPEKIALTQTTKPAKTS